MQKSEDNFMQVYSQLILAINSCLENRYLVPALILIYTAIDSVSWLSTGDIQNGGKRFQDWVDQWMLAKYPLPCTAKEIYSARCGVLHTLTPNSKLTEKGVRKIAYAWGDASEIDLAESISTLGRDNSLIAVHMESLFHSFRNGFVDFLLATQNNPEIAKIFQKGIQQYFSDIDKQTINKFLEMSKTRHEQ